MNKKFKLAVITLAAMLAFCFISCDTETEKDVIISFENFSTSSIIIRNMTDKRFVAFKGTPSANTLIGGIPEFANNHGLEKKESLFNETGGFVLTLITEEEYEKNKNNLSLAPVFTRIYAFYNHEANNNKIYQISSFLGGEGQVIINNPTSWNVIIRRYGPTTGELLGFIAPNTTNSIIRLEIPDTYDLYPVFIKYNSFTKELTEIIPKYTTGIDQNKAYMRTFELFDSTPYNWDLTEITSSIDFEMTTGGFFIKIQNDSSVAVSLTRANEILTTSSGFTYINPGNEYLFYIRVNRNPDGTYPLSTGSISNFSIGNSVITYPLPVNNYKIDYIYSVRVTGENINLLEVGDIEEVGLMDLGL